MIVNFETSELFLKNFEAEEPLIVNQGGSRSGKTYSILQVLVAKALGCTGKTFTIARKTLKALRPTAMRDFFDILNKAELYDEAKHNKTENIYMLHGNRIEFIGMDDSQKKRGAKRHILFCNEANELAKSDFLQLELRTTEQIFIDFNPSDEYHWLYEDAIPRAKFIKSTFLDNPFLDELTISRIKRLKKTDPEAWKVYGLGERAVSKETIFSIQIAPPPKEAKLISYGLDFGFSNDPSSLVEVKVDGDNLYLTELIHRTGMTNQDIAREFQRLAIDRRVPIYADSSEPKSIEEIYRHGWNIKPSLKGKDSVNAGIQQMKTFVIHINPDSKDLIKEFRNYKWEKDKNGRIINRARDEWNHGVDASRYGLTSHLSKPNRGKYHLR